MALPSLRDQYGKGYRVGRDPCADSWHDPALHTIPTASGCVYVHSATHAGVEVERRRRAIRRRLTEAGYAIHQEGDDLTCFLVPWEDLGGLLPMLRAYRRRQLTEEQRAAAVARLARFKFQRSPDAPTDAPAGLNASRQG